LAVQAGGDGHPGRLDEAAAHQHDLGQPGEPRLSGRLVQPVLLAGLRHRGAVWEPTAQQIIRINPAMMPA
jgi:hypothetical protein